MASSSLGILGLGSYLPESKPVRQVVDEAGGDSTVHTSWENIRIARDDEHPSEMAQKALNQALERSGVSSERLKLILFTGLCRDFPSMTVAAELIRLVNANRSCVGFDMNSGCMGMIGALDFANGWLETKGGGYVAIVSAEKWAYSIDHSDESNQNLWAFSDGAAAAIVGKNVPEKPIWEYLGSAYRTNPDYVDLVKVKYGGSKFPVTPADNRNYMYVRSDKPSPKVLMEVYTAAYSAAAEELFTKLQVRPNWMASNQTHPEIVRTFAKAMGVPPENASMVGAETGHIGAADLMLGLEQLKKRNQVRGYTVLLNNSTFSFGVGMLKSEVESGSSGTS